MYKWLTNGGFNFTLQHPSLFTAATGGWLRSKSRSSIGFLVFTNSLASCSISANSLGSLRSVPRSHVISSEGWLQLAMAGSRRGSTMTLVIGCCAILLMLVGRTAHAADPDPLQDFCVADLSPSAPLMNGFACKPRSTVSVKDFVFSGFRAPTADVKQAVTGAVANVITAVDFPGLNTQGVTHGRLDFDLGGVVPLHTHPRATETLLVLKGRIYTGFVSDDDVLYAATLEKGDVIVFPRALLHFQLNVGNESAITFNTLTSQNPGLLLTANQIFTPNITSAVIEKSFGVDAATAKLLKGSYPGHP